MTVNNYDDLAIKRAKEFASGANLHHAYIEKPAMFALLPDLVGKRALCLGCGTGEETQQLLQLGAEVVGVDISSVSIDYAKANIVDASFFVADMDKDLDVLANEQPFDLIYSSFTIHYSNDPERLFSRLGALLAPGGVLLFSVVHPIKWASETTRDPENDRKKSFIMGYEMNGDQHHVYGDYLGSRQNVHKYPDGMVQKLWSRPVSHYFKLLQTTGFTVQEFIEPSAAPESEVIDPAFYDIYTKIPLVAIFKAEK